jgi:hypothetical protein
MKRRLKMKKMMILTAAFMFVLTSMAYAGGDQNCGSKASGAAGSTGKGTVTQNRPPAD